MSSKPSQELHHGFGHKAMNLPDGRVKVPAPCPGTHSMFGLLGRSCPRTSTPPLHESMRNPYAASNVCDLHIEADSPA